MSTLIDWLEAGDLRSDGFANQVAELVLANPADADELIDALEHDNKALRGHSADALEKVCRSRPDLFIDDLPAIIQHALHDPVTMVRFHLAMVLGHFLVYEEHMEQIGETLESMLNDRTAFARSWALTSLCILGLISPEKRSLVVQEISRLANDNSSAVRNRAGKALGALMGRKPLPAGWVKSAKNKMQIDKIIG